MTRADQVIASEAKQSRRYSKRLLRRWTPRNDTSYIVLDYSLAVKEDIEGPVNTTFLTKEHLVPLKSRVMIYYRF